MKRLLLATATCAAFATPVLAQSSVQLDSFGLDLDSVGTPSVTPTAPATKRAPAETSAFGTCLRDQTACAGSAMGASAAISLEDVQNLGVIDRTKIATTVSTDDNTKVPIKVTEPLPSIDVEVFFDYNSANIRYDQFGQLNELSDVLSHPDFKKYTLLFVGHTDSVGSASYNQALSAQRANAVAQYVRQTANLQYDRVSSAGVGFTRLKTPWDGENAQNRRVQLVLVPR